MTWKINEKAIRDLTIGFTRSHGPLGNAIALCAGGWRAVKDKSFPTHAFFFLHIEGRLFAFEQTGQGLRPVALSEYATDRNRIIACYYCHCWDDPRRRGNAIDYLMDIWYEGGEPQEYGLRTMAHKIPWVGRLIRPDDVETICSQNVAKVLQICGGVSWFDKSGTELRPDELLQALKVGRMMNQVESVINYYE